MKKLFSRLLPMLICLSLLASCSALERPALEVADAKLSAGIYKYFYDTARSDAEASGADLLDDAAIREDAVLRCTRYVAANTVFGSYGLTLDTAAKAAVSTEVNDLWAYYSRYYTSVGITKQELTDIKTGEAKRTKLLLFFFGEGSEYEVTEAEIEYYFDKSYVAFRSLTGYFTTTDESGAEVSLPADEIAAIKADFQKKLAILKEEGDFSAVNDGESVDVSFVSMTNSAYPEGFLQKVSELEYDKPVLIETATDIFLVERVNAKTGDDNYYENYRTQYVEALRGDALTEMLTSTAEEYPLISHESVLKRCEKTVTKARNERKGL